MNHALVSSQYCHSWGDLLKSDAILKALISTESRQRHWDKFGKLLNITDGLIGQGREDIFLITFNEKLQAIDPAIVRPGRCISRTQEPCSLAELYQIKAKAKKNVPVTV